MVPVNTQLEETPKQVEQWSRLALERFAEIAKDRTLQMCGNCSFNTAQLNTVYNAELNINFIQDETKSLRMAARFIIQHRLTGSTSQTQLLCINKPPILA